MDLACFRRLELEEPPWKSFPTSMRLIVKMDGKTNLFSEKIDYELACFTQADLEKHFGNGHYERDRSAIGRDSYIGEPAYVCFRRGDKTISFFFPFSSQESKCYTNLQYCLESQCEIT